MLKGLLLAMCLRQHSQSLQAEEQRRSQRMVIRVPAVVTVLSGDVLNDPASEAELVSEELGSSTPGTKPEALAATDLKQPVTITQVSIRVSTLTAVWADPPFLDAGPVQSYKRAWLILPGQTKVLQMRHVAASPLVMAEPQATSATLQNSHPPLQLDGTQSVMTVPSVATIWIVPQW